LGPPRTAVYPAFRGLLLLRPLYLAGRSQVRYNYHVLVAGLQLAGFQVITTGRFWVIPEGMIPPALETWTCLPLSGKART
jgi:hypothetical protein